MEVDSRERREGSRFVGAGNSTLLHRDRGWWSTFVVVGWGSSFVVRGTGVEDGSNRIGVARGAGDSCSHEIPAGRVARMGGKKTEMRQVDL